MIKNAFRHFITICKHKWYVFTYCVRAGIAWRGIVHDLSKFSPTEFFESIKYYQGTSSPIDFCKKINGYSLAWQHHKGHNKHHYEYWTDNYDSGGECICIPYEYCVEMICDMVGAARAYLGNKFTYSGERDWWNKKRKVAQMHPVVDYFLNYCFNYMFIYNKFIPKEDMYNAYLVAISNFGTKNVKFRGKN